MIEDAYVANRSIAAKPLRQIRRNPPFSGREVNDDRWKGVSTAADHTKCRLSLSLLSRRGPQDRSVPTEGQQGTLAVAGLRSGRPRHRNVPRRIPPYVWQSHRRSVSRTKGLPPIGGDRRPVRLVRFPRMTDRDVHGGLSNLSQPTDRLGEVPTDLIAAIALVRGGDISKPTDRLQRLLGMGMLGNRSLDRLSVSHRRESSLQADPLINQWFVGGPWDAVCSGVGAGCLSVTTKAALPRWKPSNETVQTLPVCPPVVSDHVRRRRHIADEESTIRA